MGQTSLLSRLAWYDPYYVSKKTGASEEDIEDDHGRICALMTDGRYEYSFGLHVIYGKDGIQALLFSKDGENIRTEKLNCS